MKSHSNAGRGAFNIGMLLGLSTLMAACVGDESPREIAVAAQAQPRMATYDCGDDGKIAVESMGGTVRLTEPEGESYELAASPPTQTSRFGGGNVALVVEGGEALWMKSGREPMTCRR